MVCGLLELEGCSSADLVSGPLPNFEFEVDLRWGSWGHKWLTREGIARLGLSDYVSSSWEAVKQSAQSLGHMEKHGHSALASRFRGQEFYPSSSWVEESE